MDATTFEIVQATGEALAFQVVVKNGDKTLFSSPAVTAAEAQDILLMMTSGARIPRRVSMDQSKASADDH